ncbi:MAG: hypothetical protein JO360_06265, partial [Acidobacteria bacterium]|nr:hypothetical protein [Acidobacteriota bacterium]
MNQTSNTDGRMNRFRARLPHMTAWRWGAAGAILLCVLFISSIGAQRRHALTAALMAQQKAYTGQWLIEMVPGKTNPQLTINFRQEEGDSRWY